MRHHLSGSLIQRKVGIKQISVIWSITIHLYENLTGAVLRTKSVGFLQAEEEGLCLWILMVQGDTLSLFLTVQGASAQNLLKISCLGQSLSQLVSPHRQMSVKSVTADHADPPRNHVRWSCRDMELWEICPTIPVPQADAPASSCPCLPPAPPHPLFATSVFISPSLLSCSLDLSIKPLPSRLLCLTAYAFLFDPFDPHISPTVSFPVYNMSGTEDLLDLCCTASLVVVCVFFVCFFAYLVLLARSCMPWCSQRAAQLLSLTGPSSAWPQLCEKGHHTNTASLKHNVAYAQLRKPHQTFLQSSALCGFSLWRPCEAKCFQTISRFHVETLHTKKEEEKIEELCIFTHAAG